MQNFWDSNVWGFILIFAVLFVFLLIGNILRKSIPFLKSSLIPTSVLGGAVLLAVSGIYEAASIDGAGRWKKMWYITLPSLANTIITVLILNLAKIMNLFESVFVLQNDAVMDVSQVLQTYVYYQTFNSGGIPDYGYTTAIGLFRSLVGMTLMLICNYASKKVRGRGIV